MNAKEQLTVDLVERLNRRLAERQLRTLLEACEGEDASYHAIYQRLHRAGYTLQMQIVRAKYPE